ncbi:MAG TPA: prepilin-type N-terminal cleavage/methylation domain-containing protein [Pyrinomonadaceae bacterium]|nr:prepilin-type N-terminal cleavage/methylation domain-containing protein [Pyrinomonadaceae bacterium]
MHKETQKNREQGFTLVETSIAMVVMMVVALSMSSLFVYSLQNNVGGNDRALAMAVAQQQLEQLRSVSFTDATLAVGTTTLPTVTIGGRSYIVIRTITNETNADGTLKSLKKISISVTPISGEKSWQRTAVILVSHRSSLATGAYAITQ